MTQRDLYEYVVNGNTNYPTIPHLQVRFSHCQLLTAGIRVITLQTAVLQLDGIRYSIPSKINV